MKFIGLRPPSLHYTFAEATFSMGTLGGQQKVRAFKFMADCWDDAVGRSVILFVCQSPYIYFVICYVEIWTNVSPLLDPTISRLLYISTDERNSSFFDPFREVYTVRFLRHYEDAAGLIPTESRTRTGVGTDKEAFNQNLVGMVEQVVCASAHTFVGTPLSTFTGYITRMRGYHRDGRYSRTFYFLPSPMYQ